MPLPPQRVPVAMKGGNRGEGMNEGKCVGELAIQFAMGSFGCWSPTPHITQFPTKKSLQVSLPVQALSLPG